MSAAETSRPASPTAVTPPTDGAPAPFAVVELFTSEGCSSCPPADQNLARIARDYAKQPVYPLSFHVDYWDSIGWRDPFSSAVYSERQRRYAAAMRARRVYTPQMVVNGTEELVGSHRARSDDVIESSLAKVPQVFIAIDVDAEPSRFRVSYRTDAPPGSTRVVVAAAQEAAETDVRAGENDGRTLRHVNVVRALETTETDPSGRGALLLRLPAGVSSRDAHVVGWVQERGTLAILAAASGR
jgi:hypothetical protein